MVWKWERRMTKVLVVDFNMHTSHSNKVSNRALSCHQTNINSSSFSKYAPITPHTSSEDSCNHNTFANEISCGFTTNETLRDTSTYFLSFFFFKKKKGCLHTITASPCW